MCIVPILGGFSNFNSIMGIYKNYPKGVRVEA